MREGSGRRGTALLWLSVAATVALDVAVVGLPAEEEPAGQQRPAVAVEERIAFAATPSRLRPVVALLPVRAVPDVPPPRPVAPAPVPPAPPPPAPPPPAPPAPASPALRQASVPIEPPADARAAEPVVVLGTIEIPELGLRVPLNQGIRLPTIDRGPSHWPGSALPGETGNVVVAGHRVTKTHPFRHIDQLVPGDEIVFHVGGVRSTYAVRAHEVVSPDAMRIVDPTPTATATLFACHPPGSARFRYVVTADLVRTDG